MKPLRHTRLPVVAGGAASASRAAAAGVGAVEEGPQGPPGPPGADSTVPGPPGPEGPPGSEITYVHPDHSGDVASVGDGLTTIGANKVTNAMLANTMPANTIKGSVAGGNPADLTTTQAKTALGLANVDNTSDANKPVSTAQAAADALRVLKAGDTMTGPLVMPPGTVAATSINFGTPGTGLSGAGSQIALSTGGTQRVLVTSTDVTIAPRISANTGSALAASIHFGTSNTGFYGGTSISATVGGANKLTLNGTDLVSTVPVTLPGAPTVDLHAATKLYADSKVSKAGDTMTGILTLQNNLQLSSVGPSIFIDKAASGQDARFVGRIGASTRWILYLGDATAESGTNNSIGSDFRLSAFDDAGIRSTPIIIPRSTGAVAIRGTNTNDSAAAGYVGEYLSASVSSGSPVALTSGVWVNLTSLSLTAGDWDVSLHAIYQPTSTTKIVREILAISTTSATGNTAPGWHASQLWDGTAGQTTASLTQTLVAGPIRISLASTTTYYANVHGVFSVSTLTAYGIFQARRVR